MWMCRGILLLDDRPLPLANLVYESVVWCGMYDRYFALVAQRLKWKNQYFHHSNRSPDLYLTDYHFGGNSECPGYAGRGNPGCFRCPISTVRVPCHLCAMIGRRVGLARRWLWSMIRWRNDSMKYISSSEETKVSTNQMGDWKDTVDGRNPANQLRLVVYPMIYKVLAPSQVVQDFFHQQYERKKMGLPLPESAKISHRESVRQSGKKPGVA